MIFVKNFGQDSKCYCLKKEDLNRVLFDNCICSNCSPTYFLVYKRKYCNTIVIYLFVFFFKYYMNDRAGSNTNLNKIMLFLFVLYYVFGKGGCICFCFVFCFSFFFLEGSCFLNDPLAITTCGCVRGHSLYFNRTFTNKPYIFRNWIQSLQIIKIQHVSSHTVR